MTHPRHIVFLSIPAHGHVVPTLGMVEALVRKGHRLSYVTTEEFADGIASFGADAVTYTSTWTVPAELPNPVSADEYAHMRRMLLEESVAYAPAAEEAFAADRPDVLVYDTSVGPVARVLARAWGCPAVQLFTGVAVSEEFSLAPQLARRFPALIKQGDPAPAELRRFFRAFVLSRGFSDLDAETMQRPFERLSLVLQPRAFQMAAETFDERRYAFVGPCLDSRRAGARWRPPDPRRRVLLVSLGTLYNNSPAFYRTCIRAFADTSWYVMMAVGNRVDRAEFGPAPPNVQLHGYLPQPAVLRHADAFLSHTGMGGTMEALSEATPIAAVPQTPEQDAVARRVEELGLGRRLVQQDISAAGLREAVNQLADDAAMTHRLRTMQDAIRVAGGADRAADLIESRAGHGGAPGTGATAGHATAPRPTRTGRHHAPDTAQQPQPPHRAAARDHATEGPPMDEVLIVIGTRKGLFTARGRPQGEDGWDLQGPCLTMQSIHCIGLDTRGPTPRIFAGTSHGHWGPGLFRSDDLGSSWQETPKAAIAFPERTGTSLVKLWEIRPAGPDQPGVVYAGAEPAALFRSRDGGETFELVEELWDHPDRERLISWIPEAGALYLHTVLTHPEDSQDITVGIAAGGVYRSTDGGATWFPSNSGIESRSLPVAYPEYGQCVHKIARVPTRPEQLFLQNHGGVYRSDDSGGTWEPIHWTLPADFGFTCVAHPHRPGTAYVFPLVADTDRMAPQGRCRVYRTQDAGATWEGLTKGLPQEHFYPSILRDALCTDDGDPAGVYLGTRGGEVYASGDDGDSWELVTRHLPDVLSVRALRLEGGTA